MLVSSGMGLALGLSGHTGWGAAVVAGGDWEKPLVVSRERLEVLGAHERCVFHTAAEMRPDEARMWVAHAKEAATELASAEGAGLGRVEGGMMAGPHA
jgi:hypothetical protein